MTIHAAKGLEFDTVFLAGWEEGLFPSQRAMDEGGTRSLEEERRLAYVAITRARRRAVILHAANRRIYGQWTSSIPSRFVGELPDGAHRQRDDDVGRRLAVAGELVRTRRSLRRCRPRHRPRPRLAARAAAAGSTFTREPSRVVESRAAAVSLGNKGRSDLSLGQRVFHQKFGYGTIAEIEGNKLEIDFEAAGRKRVMDSFVTAGRVTTTRYFDEQVLRKRPYLRVEWIEATLAYPCAGPINQTAACASGGALSGRTERRMCCAPRRWRTAKPSTTPSSTATSRRPTREAALLSAKPTASISNSPLPRAARRGRSAIRSMSTSVRMGVWSGSTSNTPPSSST